MKTSEVWVLYANDIQKFIFSKIKNVANTEDVLQETFLKVHTKLHTLKAPSKIKPWVFTIARNSIIDFFKLNKPSIDITTLEFSEEVYNTESAHNEQDCLRGIIKKLPKKYRTPLFLSDIKGMKQQEVALQLNQSLSTTKSQIQRARKLIAKGFMDCCGFVLNEDGKLVGELQEKEDCKICK